MKIVEVNRTKEFASTFLQDPILRMAVNAVLDAAPEAEIQRWIPVTEPPADFLSVLGHMTDAGDFPAVRECYRIDDGYFFPALNEFHPIDKWMPIPEPPEEVSK